MERKLPGKSFRKFGDTSRGCPALLGNLGKCWSTRYWKLPKFKSYFLVELKAPFNFFCILSLQQLTETEKKKLRQDKETIQLSTCAVFDLSFFILYLLHLYRYTCKMNLSTCIIPDQFFFFLLRCFNHEAKSPHMINPHENKNSLYIYSKSSSTKVHLKMHLFLQMSHYHM